jgi:hypothetical protein
MPGWRSRVVLAPAGMPAGAGYEKDSDVGELRNTGCPAVVVWR